MVRLASTGKVIWGEPEHVLSWHTNVTAGFVTVCCSMSMVSKTLWSHFACQGNYATHTLGLNFTIKSWAESLVLMSVITRGPYLMLRLAPITTFDHYFIPHSLILIPQCPAFHEQYIQCVQWPKEEHSQSTSPTHCGHTHNYPSCPFMVSTQVSMFEHLWVLWWC